MTEFIGQGGMARVYKGVDQRLGRTVAVKVIHPGIAADPRFAQHFINEAQIAALLNHPNIVSVSTSDRGDTLLVNRSVDGKGSVDLVAPYADRFHFDVRNSFWNARETADVTVFRCQY